MAFQSGAKRRCMPMMSWYLLLTIFVASLESIDGIAWKWSTYPNALNDKTDSCKRGRNISWTWICDPDSVMSRNNSNTIEEMLELVRTKSQSKCSPRGAQEPGYRLGVAIARQIYNDGQSKEARFRDFAYNVREFRWRIPLRSWCDDSILMVVSKNDRYVYISTGRIARDKLTDCAVRKVINEMRPYLSKGHFAGGIAVGVKEINFYLRGVRSSSCEPVKSKSALSVGIIVLIVLLCMLVPFFVCLAVCVRKGKCSSGGRGSSGRSWGGTHSSWGHDWSISSSGGGGGGGGGGGDGDGGCGGDF